MFNFCFIFIAMTSKKRNASKISKLIPKKYPKRIFQSIFPNESSIDEGQLNNIYLAQIITVTSVWKTGESGDINISTSPHPPYPGPSILKNFHWRMVMVWFTGLCKSGLYSPAKIQMSSLQKTFRLVRVLFLFLFSLFFFNVRPP